MKNKFKSLLVLLMAAVLFNACKKPGQQSETKVAIPAAHGRILGSAVEKNIGAAGGSIETADGSMKVTIPAGAVSSETVFTIQPVEKTLTSGTGTAYRLGPENVTFNKDLEISFKYTDTDLAGTNEDYLYLAYQDSKGFWNREVKTELDKVNKSLKVKTRHFSDWVTEREFWIIPGKDKLEANQEIQPKAYYEDMENGTSKILQEYEIKPENIINWFIHGLGSITSQNPATYKAPPTISNPSTVELGVKIKNLVNRTNPNRPGNSGEVTVIVPIYLVGQEFFIWSAEGTDYVSTSQHAAMIGFLAIDGLNSQSSMTLMINATKAGRYKLGNQSTPEKFSATFTLSGNQRIYQGFYTTCAEPTVQYGNGEVNITEFGPIGGFISGNFYAIVYYRTGCTNENRQVTGSFKIRREI